MRRSLASPGDPAEIMAWIEHSVPKEFWPDVSIAEVKGKTVLRAQFHEDKYACLFKLFWVYDSQ